ncbi:MAG: LysR family transcriptional regulator [Chlamydiales bacterium]
MEDSYPDQLFEENVLQRIENSLRNIRLADLEIFISAAHMKNLGRAAQAHHLSQSAASAAIQRVETAFRQELCTHERRQFRLTREGQLLLPKIEGIIKQIRDLIVSGDESPIRLVTTHAIAQIAVPSLLSLKKIDFKHMRPDQAYAAILATEADMALVLDNYPWKGVIAAEVGKGHFQLYCRKKDVPLKPVLLPEDQMEVLFLQQTWLQVRGYALPVKSRIPSWSLIGQICEATDEVGFLPDFLAQKFGLHPVLWQPAPSLYRILAIYRGVGSQLQDCFDTILHLLCEVFSYSS